MLPALHRVVHDVGIHRQRIDDLITQGIDEEIALLRVKIKSLVENDPDNFSLIMQAIATLARILRTKNNIGKKDRQGLRAAIGNVLKDIALPLGVGIGATLGD